MNRLDRLSVIDIAQPVPASPVAAHIPSVEAGGPLRLAGRLSFRADGSLICGRLGADLGIDEGPAPARACGVMPMAQIDAAVGRLDKVARMVKLGVFVNSTVDVADWPKVANGTPQLMQDVIGDAGRDARSAAGMPTLPLGVAVEVDAVVAVR